MPATTRFTSLSAALTPTMAAQSLHMSSTAFADVLRMDVAVAANLEPAMARVRANMKFQQAIQALNPDTGNSLRKRKRRCIYNEAKGDTHLNPPVLGSTHCAVTTDRAALSSGWMECFAKKVHWSLGMTLSFLTVSAFVASS